MFAAEIRRSKGEWLAADMSVSWGLFLPGLEQSLCATEAFLLTSDAEPSEVGVPRNGADT